MNDMAWLDRVWLAYRVYNSQHDRKDQNVEHFIRYLYRQYGIVHPEQRQDYERQVKHSQ